MYHCGQIVYDLDVCNPVEIGGNDDDHLSRKTHFLECEDSEEGPTRYIISSPKSVAEAKLLLKRNMITPAPLPPTHCWKCRNWKENCIAFHCTNRKILPQHLATEVQPK